MSASGQSQKAFPGLSAWPAALREVDEGLARGEDAGALGFRRGSILARWRRYREALDAFRLAALTWEPNASLLSEWAWTHYLQGDIAAALDLHLRAVSLAPDDVDVRFGHAMALLSARRLDDALAEFRFVAGAAPDHEDCALHIAQCLHQLGDNIAAERAIARALDVIPGDPRMWALLGAVLAALGRETECLRAFEHARTLEVSTGTDGGTPRPQAASLLQFGHAREALAACEAGLRRGAELPLHATYAFSLLTTGRLAEGWVQYEYRWMQDPMLSLRPKFELPPWAGQPLEGKTILLRAEQGFGDIAQFARYAQVLRARGARVILQVHDGFGTIAHGFVDVDRVITKGEAFTAFDYWAHLLSLPRLLGSRTGFDVRFPYLLPDPERRARWEARLERRKPPRVGVAWAGNPEHLRDRARSIPLESLVDLLDEPSVQFISLQKFPRSGDEEVMKRMPGLFDVRSELVDFADTAALIATLDLVICVDTAIAHIAGAMGRPVWVMLPFAADFRWLQNRSDTPWYPGMRLFRQVVAGEWADVIAQVKLDLRQFDPTAVHLPPAWDGLDDVPGRRADPPFPEVAETDVGIMQVVPEGGEACRSLLYYGSYGLARRDLIARVLPRDAWVLEVAPGVGAETLWLCKVLDPDGHLLCYEDNAFLAAVLRNNLEANGCEGRVSMPRGRLVGPHDAGRAREYGHSHEHTIDELRMARLDLIMIHDTVTAAGLVAGADSTLWSLRPAVLVDLPPEHTDIPVTMTLREHGYLCWRLRFPLFSAENFYRRAEDIFAGRSISAILALPEESPRVADVPSRLVEASF